MMIGYLNSIIKHIVLKNYNKVDYSSFDLVKLDESSKNIQKLEIYF